MPGMNMAQNLGIVTGVVTKAAGGAPVAGATVSVTNSANGIQFSASTDEQGRAASDDLIDMMHTHPMIADGGAEVEFNVVFPRAHGYRVWVQFQRKGVVNTMRFDVPVQSLPRYTRRRNHDRPVTGA